MIWSNEDSSALCLLPEHFVLNVHAVLEGESQQARTN